VQPLLCSSHIFPILRCKTSNKQSKEGIALPIMEIRAIALLAFLGVIWLVALPSLVLFWQKRHQPFFALRSPRYTITYTILSSFLYSRHAIPIIATLSDVMCVCWEIRAVISPIPFVLLCRSNQLCQWLAACLLWEIGYVGWAHVAHCCI
jgi:hypothetical protein